VRIGDGCNFVHNKVKKVGGAIYSDKRVFVGENCIFKNNVAKKDSGAIFAREGGPVAKSSTFIGNKPNDY
jgi:predicted outer membrane repeat protein